MNKFKVYITFDLDYADYTNGWRIRDEFKIVEDIILPYLEQNNILATWFIRLDKKMEYDFGKPDYLFIKHKSIIDKLLSLGHCIAWHPHCYKYENNRWIQNVDENSVLNELNYLLPFVKKYNLNIVRMGWGYQTNKTMKFFNDNGFIIDSSCIARPKYKWDLSSKDWEISSNMPYHPSVDDYRISGKNSLEILEVPITTVEMLVDIDTEVVKRYINLSFYNNILVNPIKKWIEKESFIVTITHPYEIYRSQQKHHIISFDFNEFKKNIEFIADFVKQCSKQIEYKTLDRFING